MKSRNRFRFYQQAYCRRQNYFRSHIYTATEVTPNTIKKFADAGRPLFKMNSKNELLMSEGKNYVCLATPTTCFVGISANDPSLSSVAALPCHASGMNNKKR